MARDRFSRSVSSGWGTADLGGSYTHTGTRTAFGVNGSRGTISLSAGNARDALLTGVSARDVDMTVTVRADKPATGWGQVTSLTARRVSSDTQYRGFLRVGPTGGVSVGAERTAGTATRLGQDAVVPGLTASAGTVLRLRVQTVGANPTTVRVKAWAGGTAEPASWTFTATDSTPALQTAGMVGVRTYLSGSATNAPVRFSLDDLVVTAL
ncbi:MAG: hypothetical protein H0V12_02120 [Chloroflexi bacterium]|nr:hypothetical protein [Chloroflexota bacterium]